MSSAPHMTLITEVLPVSRRDFPFADTTLLNPNVTNPVFDGEWLELNSSYQLARASGENVSKPNWQLFAERGRYDTQAIGKGPVLFIHGYEAETDIVTFTGIGVGDKLAVTDVSMGGQNKRGLFKPTAGGQHLIHAWCTRLIGPSGAPTKVRYWCPNAPTFYTI